MTDQKSPTLLSVPLAAVLAWLVPGMGHLYLKHRVRGLVLLVTITVTFWTGVAIGSVQGTIAPHSKKLWFLAQLGAGGNTLVAYGLHCVVAPESARSSKPVYAGHWVSADVGVHFTGVAGLLNLLVILDAITLADPSRASGTRRRIAGGVP